MKSTRQPRSWSSGSPAVCPRNLWFELLIHMTEMQCDAGGLVISAMQAHMLKQNSTAPCCSTTGSHFRGSHSKPVSQRGVVQIEPTCFWEQHRSAPRQRSCCLLNHPACLPLPCQPADSRDSVAPTAPWSEAQHPLMSYCTPSRNRSGPQERTYRGNTEGFMVIPGSAAGLKPCTTWSWEGLPCSLQWQQQSEPHTEI